MPPPDRRPALLSFTSSDVGRPDLPKISLCDQRLRQRFGFLDDSFVDCWGPSRNRPSSAAGRRRPMHIGATESKDQVDDAIVRECMKAKGYIVQLETK